MTAPSLGVTTLAASFPPTRSRDIAFVAGALLAGLAMISYPHPASAQDCDCSVKRGDCSANASMNGSWIDFTANTGQCAYIVYRTGSDPATITITDGSGSIQYLGMTPRLNVVVDSCTICATAGTTARIRPPAPSGTRTTGYYPPVSSGTGTTRLYRTAPFGTGGAKGDWGGVALDADPNRVGDALDPAIAQRVLQQVR